MAIKQSKSRKAFVVINYFLLGLLAIICIFPFIHLLAVSLSSDEFTSAGLVSIYPRGFTFDAYKILATKPEFFKAFGISVARTILGTALALLVIILTAYPLSKSNKILKGRTGAYTASKKDLPSACKNWSSFSWCLHKAKLHNGRKTCSEKLYAKSQRL